MELGTSKNALLSKVSTLVDGSIRVTLDFSINDMPLITKLMALISANQTLVEVSFRRKNEDQGPRY